jgi:hypothetical protein
VEASQDHKTSRTFSEHQSKFFAEVFWGGLWGAVGGMFKGILKNFVGNGLDQDM